MGGEEDEYYGMTGTRNDLIGREWCEERIFGIWHGHFIHRQVSVAIVYQPN